ncbi:MAG: class I SAM-dependent methyltransferase [Patescibacteria group bacterium]
MKSKKIYSFIGLIAPLYDLCLYFIGYKKSVDYFISQLPFTKESSITVLDAGCGIGLYSLAILKKYKNARVTSFDFSDKLVGHLKEKALKNKYNNRVHLFTADIQSALKEIGDEKFNLIITSGVLEYVPQEKTLKNLSRFLISGGYFLNSPVRDTLWGELVCKLYACKPYSRTQNIQAFEHNNFTLQKIIKLPWYAPASFKEAHLFMYFKTAHLTK